jgi:outer membrane protein assembly factor BamB
MAKRSEIVYIGIKNCVLAIRSATGEQIWRTELKRGGLEINLITLQLDGDVVYAGAAGELYCLDRTTGNILWHNPLKGLGHGAITFGATSTTAVAAICAAQAAAAAASTGIIAAG